MKPPNCSSAVMSEALWGKMTLLLDDLTVITPIQKRMLGKIVKHYSRCPIYSGTCKRKG